VPELTDIIIDATPAAILGRLFYCPETIMALPTDQRAQRCTACRCWYVNVCRCEVERRAINEQRLAGLEQPIRGIVSAGLGTCQVMRAEYVDAHTVEISLVGHDGPLTRCYRRINGQWRPIPESDCKPDTWSERAAWSNAVRVAI
jgi:hypothetical protein